MTVIDLKLLLDAVPGDTPVLIPAFDHSYREGRASVGTAMLRGREWTEDHGDEFTPEGEDYGVRRQVLVVS